MKNLDKFIHDASEQDFVVTERVDGKRTIYQPDRNVLRMAAEIALYEDLKELGYNVYRNKGMVAIVADNEEVGNITFQFKVSVADLDYEAGDEEDDYLAELEEKRIAREERERKKQEKLERKKLAQEAKEQNE